MTFILDDSRFNIVLDHDIIPWTGWPDSPGVTPSFADGNPGVFTVTDGGSAYYYIQGTKYVLGGNKSVNVTNTEGIWFIYFSGSTLTASQTPWTITDDDKAHVGYVLWDDTNKKHIFLGYEFHNYIMDAATHSHFHNSIGALWRSGLAVSDTGSDTVNVSAGVIADEDIEISVTDATLTGTFDQALSPLEAPIYYLDSGNWRVLDTHDKNNATDVGYVSGTDLQYNNAGALAAVSSANHIAMWCLATNNMRKPTFDGGARLYAEPVIWLLGQRQDVTLAAAIDNNVFSGLSLDSALSQESVLLARVIIKESAAGLYYTIEDITDYRGTVSVGNGINIGVNDHGALSGLGDDDHPQYRWDTDDNIIATQVFARR